MDRRIEKGRSIGRLMDGYEAREIYRNFLTASCIVVVLDKKETAAVSKCEYFRSQ